MRREVEREPDPTANLRTLWQIDHMPYPVERSRRELEQARQVAPDDDRVWLALADLATRTGRFEEAEEWLMRCERARPDDRAVWRARLDWAQAADRPDEVVRAASHLPVSLFTQAHVLELRAWMAARRGDRQAERAALESKIALEPADSAAVERLADLAAQDGERERLAELRRRKAAIDAARVRYQALVRIPDLTTHIPELARAAEAIGRPFDAKAWWALAARRDRSIAAEAAGRARSAGQGRAGARARREGAGRPAWAVPAAGESEDRGPRHVEHSSVHRRRRATRRRFHLRQRAQRPLPAP